MKAERFKTEKSSRFDKRLLLRVISEEAEVSSMSDEWNELCQECPESDLFQTADYCRNWWVAFGRSYEMRVYAVRDHSGRLIGLLPAYLARCRKLGRDYYELRFIGSHGASDDGYFDLIARPKDRARVSGMIVPSMLGEGADWSSVRLTGVPTESPFARLLMKELGMSVEACPRTKHAIVELPPSWSLYVGTLEAQNRELVQIARERAGFDASVAFVTDTAPQAIIDAIDRYANMGKAARSRPLAKENGFFLNRLARDLARNARIKTYRALQDNHPVAILVTYSWGGTTYVGEVRSDKAACDPQLELALCIEAVKDAIALGATRCDFLRSTSTAGLLAPQTRETIDLQATRPGAVRQGLAGHLWSLLGR